MADDSATLKVPGLGKQSAPQTQNIPERTQRLIQGLRAVIDHHDTTQSQQMFEADGQEETLYRAYESLRNSLEYTEEHLLIRGAVARYLRRNFRGKSAKVLVKKMLVDLIRAGYIKNGTLPKSSVDALEHIVESYQTVLGQLQLEQESGGYTEFIGIVSAHIQDIISDNFRAPVVINFIHNHLLDRFEEENTSLADISMYIAVERNLFKSDQETITSRLFRRYFGGYLGSDPATIAAQYKNLMMAIEEARHSDVLVRAQSFVRKESAAALVLVDILDETNEPEALINPDVLYTAVRRSAEDLYGRAQKRMSRAVVRSMIFLVLTKALIGLGIEIPYDLWSHGEIIILPLAINVLFPPLYLLLISSTIRRPDETNTQLAGKQVEAILYHPETMDSSSDLEPEGGSSTRTFFNTLYLLFSGLLMFGLVQLLLSLEFNIVSMGVFLVYFSSVSFFSYRIGNVIRELKVYRRRDSGALNTLISILTAPFVRVGQWLSARYQGINVMVFIFDFLIEAPFKSIATLYKRWTAFLREKQDEAL